MTNWFANPDSHPHRVTNTQCHIDADISPDDGHIVARNMQRKKNKHIKKSYVPRWFYLQHYTGMHGQQNIK
jgi:hypothetical protein